MNLKKLIEITKSHVEEGKSIDDVVKLYAAKNYYHILVIQALSISYKIDYEVVKKSVYTNPYYSKFQQEKNPFNEEFNEKNK